MSVPLPCDDATVDCQWLKHLNLKEMQHSIANRLPKEVKANKFYLKRALLYAIYMTRNRRQHSRLNGFTIFFCDYCHFVNLQNTFLTDFNTMTQNALYIQNVAMHMN